MSAGLFSTVAPKDHFSFFHNGQLNPGGVVKTLNFKKEDVSKATGTPLLSVRWDEDMPTNVRERLTEWANLLNIVAQHFKGDVHKTNMWFTMTNPLLGNIAPRDMIRFGRYKKLLKFVVQSIEDQGR